MTALDDDPIDDEFANRLAEVDEVFASGDTRKIVEATTDPILKNRLLEAQVCLRLLHAAWSLPAETGAAVAADLPGLRAHPHQIGRFEIEGELGRGGHGVVFLAYDSKLKRQVAVKVPRPENLISASMRARFQQEAATAANLDHPNLVAIYEFESAGPITYLVMAHCPGVSLATWLKQQTTLADPFLIVRLMLPLVEAVAYMHAHGVLHRDIKPANILLDSTDWRLGDALPGIPKLTDFGLAILAEVNTRHSMSGGTVGTLAYMPPEQINMKRSSIGPRLDIFSLGAVLYQCLTGKSPFQGVTEADTISQLLLNDPVPPRQLRQSIPRDLEVICGKCLEKQPEHRYASASALADDLNRLLSGRPILARPASVIEIAMKMARRYPSITAMSAITTIAILSLLGLGIWHTVSLEEHSRKLQSALTLVESSERQLSIENYPVQIRIADSLREKENLESLSEFLDGLRPKANQADHRGFEWYFLKNIGSPLRALRGHRDSVEAVAVSPDGRHIVSSSYDGTIHFWNTATGENVGTMTGVKPDLPFMRVTHIAYCRDGKNIATLASDDRGTSEVAIWDTVTKQSVARMAGDGFQDIWSLLALATDDIVGFVGFDTDGNHRIALWDWSHGEIKHLEPLPKLPEDCWWHATVSQDGRKLIAASDAFSEIRVWDMPSGEHRAALVEDDAGVSCIALSPDGKLLASSTTNNRIRIWDLASGRAIHTGSSLGRPIARIGFQPTGQSLAIGYRDRPDWDFVQLYDANLAESNFKIISVACRITEFAWVPDGQMLAIAGADRLLRLWRPFSAPATSTLSVKGRKEAWALAFSPDSRTLAVGYDDEEGADQETLKVWDVESGKETHQLRGHRSMVTGVAFSPKDDRLYSASYDRSIKIWNLKTHSFIADLSVGQGAIKSLTISPDGTKLATCGKDKVLKIHDTRTNELVFNLGPHGETLQAAAFDPTGNRVAVADNLSNVWVWNVRNNGLVRNVGDGNSPTFAPPSASAPPGQKLQHLTDAVPVMALAFSPDGTRLATANQDGIITVHDMASSTEPMRLTAHKKGVNIAVAFAPDGKTLATGGVDNAVRLWHVATGRELLSLGNLSASVNRLTFSPDGRHLAAGLIDGTVQLWHATPPD